MSTRCTCLAPERVPRAASAAFGLGFQGLHLFVGQSEVMPDLVDYGLTDFLDDIVFRAADGLDILLVDDDDFWQRIGCHRGLLKLTGSLVQPKDVAPELARDLPGRIGLDHDSDVLQTIGEPRG